MSRARYGNAWPTHKGRAREQRKMRARLRRPGELARVERLRREAADRRAAAERAAKLARLDAQRAAYKAQLREGSR